MALYSLQLLLLSFLVKDVSGSISLSTDSETVAVGSSVTLTCNNSLKTSSIFYFNTSVKLCECKTLSSTCPVTNTTLYDSSFNGGTNFNTYTCTVKSFTKEYCGSFSCNETSVSDTIKINYFANFGEPCGTCGVCSGGQICSSDSKCECPSGQKNQNGTCAETPANNSVAEIGNASAGLIAVDSAEVVIVGTVCVCARYNIFVPPLWVMSTVTFAMYLNVVWSVTMDFLLIGYTVPDWCIALINIALYRSLVSAVVKMIVMTYYSARRPGKLLRKLTCCGKMEKEELIDLAFVLFVIDYIPWTFGLILLAPYYCKKGQLAKTVESFCANDSEELPHGQRTGHSDAGRGRAAESTRPKDKHQAALIDKSSRHVHEQPRPQPPPPLPGIGKSHNDKGIAEPHNTNTRGLSINYDDPNTMPQFDVRKSSLAPISAGFQEESDRKKKKRNKKKKTEGNDAGRIEED